MVFEYAFAYSRIPIKLRGFLTHFHNPKTPKPVLWERVLKQANGLKREISSVSTRFAE